MPTALASSIRVRARVEEDDELIVRLSASAFGEYAPGAGVSTLRMAQAGRAWVALLGDERVGFAIVDGTGERNAELVAIAVTEHARGRGVGKALLAFVERDLARAGTRELTLHTAEANASALELFVKRGFRSERLLPRFYRNVYPAWVMRKRIA